MSLVNYYSSSDDESSNGEEKTEEKPNVEFRSVKLEEHEESSAMSEHSEERPRTKSSLFSTLPAPKSSERDVPEESGSFPAPATGTTSSSMGGLLNLPAPKKKSAQPIKITAPSLPEINSDDEDDEPVTKKAKPAKGLAGLFAMLPKPRNASLKETNRILIPHTLTKRPAPSSKTTHKPAGKVTSSQPAAAKPKPTGLATSYASDEEDDNDTGATSFFSFGETPKPVSGPPSTTVTKSVPHRFKISPSTSVTVGPVVNEQAFQRTPPVASSSKDPTNPVGPSKVDSTAPPSFGQSVPQDAPLTFKPTNPPMGQDAPLAFSKPMNSSSQYGYNTSQYAEPQPYQTPYGYDYTEYNQSYQEQDPSVYGEVEGGDSEGTQGAGGSTDLAADKEFQRLMGKRNVGRESINITDIAADEVIGPTNHLDWLKKNLTEEKEYRAKLRKEQLPSGQQRRKHQITYLAHQAKERELELKNQWANNRQTRKDTQMKYGF
ncbi:proline-rich protein PRCC-like isoform X2 [Patiria miniata]|uniref:Proline-rich protein PRCC n=1 Tax=Patiria miniata TaxID=46514 RepID=A0A914BBT0_PATMI|nr:proline-rich protein PRCC-like isoform X2 [Patiria miniata]